MRICGMCEERSDELKEFCEERRGVVLVVTSLLTPPYLELLQGQLRNIDRERLLVARRHFTQIRLAKASAALETLCLSLYANVKVMEDYRDPILGEHDVELNVLCSLLASLGEAE